MLLFLFFSRALIVADSNYDWLIAFSAHIVSCFIGYPWASLTNQNAFVVKKEFFFTFYLFLHLFILRFYFEEWTIHKRRMNFPVTSKVATKEGLKMACKVSLCKIYSWVSSKNCSWNAKCSSNWIWGQDSSFVPRVVSFSPENAVKHIRENLHFYWVENTSSR